MLFSFVGKTHRSRLAATGRVSSWDQYVGWSDERFNQTDLSRWRRVPATGKLRKARLNKKPLCAAQKPSVMGAALVFFVQSNFRRRQSRPRRPGQRWTGSSQRRDISQAARAVERGFPGGKPPLRDRIPHSLHNFLEIVQVVPGQQHPRDHLLRAEYVMQIGA